MRMAAARVASWRRLCVRYKLFFYIAAFIVCIQMFMAYNFYPTNPGDLNTRGDGEQPDNGHEPKPPERAVTNGESKGGGAAADGPRPNHGRNHPGRSNPGTNTTVFKRKCDLSKFDEAERALSRAKTEECKQELADISCKLIAGSLYVKTLPRYCPYKGRNGGEYLGCFRDNRNSRDLHGENIRFEDSNSPIKCINHCLRTGFQFAGMQYGVECWCGNQYGTLGELPDKTCDSRCPGSAQHKCGGYLANNVYRTGLGEKPHNPVGIVMPDEVKGETPARVVYMLTINGRSARQVHRLIRNLYSPHTYFYIHVDARQEFLYRELTASTAPYSNMRLTTWRMSTIWGGASLLTMLLRAMTDLLEMTDWKWDFFVNLSESDFPIKKQEELTAFLTKYKDFNFVRSHSGNTQRFIRKQGLDRTFHQCDNRMWRLGTRDLPNGIRMDGGSDWIGLNRKFIQYVTSTQDKLVMGLKQFYTYTLLPAESFFHTVLQNSEYCTTMVHTNNLHITNWNRKRGCKCQYRHIVDWCGCSPNDFVPSDWPKLQAQEVKPVYFGRKFEPIINLKIINTVETYLLNRKSPASLPGLNAHWQNIYHYKDINTPVDDAALTYYHSFARMTIQRLEHDGICGVTLTQILGAHVYSFNDQIQGILLWFQAKSQKTGAKVVLEVLMSKIKKFQVYNTDSPAGRLKDLEVGTQFDPKEEVFRNYGSFIGPHSFVELKHSWAAGMQFSPHFVFINAAIEFDSSKEEALHSNEHTELLQPELDTPMRPGVWTVKMIHNWKVVAETKFLVIPLSHMDDEEIKPRVAQEIHKGSLGTKRQEDFQGLAQLLQLPDKKVYLEEANKKAQLTGAALSQWIDSLVKEFYEISNICISDKHKQQDCMSLPNCQSTAWSSLSPDPKSDLSNIDTDAERAR